MGWGKPTSWVPDPAQARVERALREKREAAERERRAKPNCRADKNVRRRG